MVAMELESLDFSARQQLIRFARQYLQAQQVLDYPQDLHLRDGAFQAALYEQIFDQNALVHGPLERYTFRVLKELITRIEGSISDWDEHV